MFIAEAEWLHQRLARLAPVEISPLANIGSSTKHFREVDQPWNEAVLFAPLKARGAKIIHVDAREGDGIDLRADIMEDDGLNRIKALAPKCVLLCNILEHVADPAQLAARCEEIAGSGGLVFVTVPYSYPYHRDPIDTMFRPAPEELAKLFKNSKMIESEIVDVRESYADMVGKKPWLLLRPIFRFPFPFISFAKWKRSMKKLYWLTHNYKVTAAVFRVKG